MRNYIMKNIKGTNLGLIRDERIVFRSLNFCLKETESLKIEGNNGSGKTSFLRAISGLISFTEGDLSYNDVRQNIDIGKKDYSCSMVYLGHKGFMNIHKTVLENLLEWAKFYDTEEILMPSLYFWSLEYFMDLPFYKLSAGWKKRVYFAYLMLSNTYFWLLDEPFANLDLATVDKLSCLINTRIRQKGMVIWSSNTSEEFLKSTIKICL